ncbi:MAG TPA: RDD family protein [Thermoplasmata archaeon]|nr:RDD family protein [Thermoplasmata archaeon]
MAALGAPSMPTAIDMIGHNAALQEHWIRRVIAAVIDALVVFVGVVFFGVFLVFFASPGWLSWWFPFVIGALFVAYGTVFEGVFGWTIGKRLLSLRVVAIGGMMDIVRAFIRNISKIHIILLVFDVLIGAATHGDPRQRWLDRFAGTSVTRVDQQAYMEEQFRMLQHAPHSLAQPGGAYTPPAGPSTPSGPAVAPPPVPGAPGGWPEPSGGWPGQTPTQSQWPQHQWDEEGKLKPQMRFCTNCGGQLVARGDGKMTCVRCGSVY